MIATGGQRRVLVLVFAAAMLTYFDRVCLSAAAPAMRAELGLSQVQMGYVFSIFNLAYGLAEVPAGWLGDRWGQKLMMFRIVSGWSLFTMLTGMVWSYGSLLSVRAVFGFAEAGAFPTLSRALSRWFAPDARSRANGWMWTGARLGGAVAPIVSAAVVHWAGWRWTFALFGVVGMAWCAAWLLGYQDNPQAKEAPRTTAPVPWRLILTNGTMLALFWAYFASGFGFQFFVTWLPTFLMKEHGLSLRQSGFYSALPLLAGAVGCMMGGFLADRFGRRAVGVCGFLFSAVAFVGSVYAGSGETAIIGLVLAAALHDVTLPVAWATCVDIGGKFGGTAGYMNLASSISGTMAPVAAAWLAEITGTFVTVFWVAAAVYAVGAALWLLIDPKRDPIG